MELLIVALIALLIGMMIGLIVSKVKLHLQSSGMLMFDRSDPAAAPYLCFESYDELDKVRNKKYVTMAVNWAEEPTRK